MTQFVKWAGGKTKILNNIFEHIPNKINNYYEPFLGGGSVLFELLRKINIGDITIDGNIYVSDINESLVYCYINIKINHDLLYFELKNLYDNYDRCLILKNEIKTKYIDKDNYLKTKENYYYYIRDKYNELTDYKTVIASSLFIFLNKTCFRGLHRMGPNGFNVPFGHYINISKLTKENIYAIHIAIQNVHFVHQDFETALSNICLNDFIYMDPPYVERQKTSFVSYNQNGYSKHKILFDICNVYNDKGIKFILSNSDTLYVREYFNMSNIKIYEIKTKHAINSKNPGKSVNELLIKNF